MENYKTWKTGGYVRLSCEDGDKEESNSVTGQKNLIRDYIGHHPELIECGLWVDDGYTGSNFERPSFREMMNEVKAGKINCIVVKDLSRFGRNYLEAGEYIERIFPFLGVRFIAINDSYDSLNSNAEWDSLIIPFKNLINEAYCRDISIKIRSQLEIKRRRGDFTGSFAVYGYRKDAGNKNHLVPDDFAAGVVRDIFRWKLKGVSTGDIADRLNEEGIASPAEYKKAEGLHFFTPFAAGDGSLWNAAAVLRILKNPVYTGALIQGKTTTPGYRMKKRMEKPQKEWTVVEGTHEAIIDREEFHTIQRVLLMDTRTSPRGRRVEIFSGMVFCGECGGPMVRKTIPSGKKRYIYYVCGAHKNEKRCFAHSISDGMLNEIVLTLLQKQIQEFLCDSDFLKLAAKMSSEKAEMKKLKERMTKKREEMERYQKLLDSLYESLAEGLLDRKEYGELKKNYERSLREAKRHMEEMDMEPDGAVAEEEDGFIEQLKKNRNITELDRAMAVLFIDKIFVFRDKRAEIVCNWRDEFQKAWKPEEKCDTL